MCPLQKCLQNVATRFCADSEDAKDRPISVLITYVNDKFSDERCAAVRLITAHSAKGETFRAVYLLGRDLFPLERAVSDGVLDRTSALEQARLSSFCLEPQLLLFY